MRWGCKNKRTDNRRTWNLREGCENKSPKRKIFYILRSSVEFWSHKSCEYHAGACTLKMHDERVSSVFTVGYT